MTLLRRVLGETLRGQRLRQRRTLREVSGAARVSLGYLSEVERGQKEASSELLASICQALDVRMSDVLREVSDLMRRTERAAGVARAPARPLVPAGVGAPAGRPGGLDRPSGLDRPVADRAPAGLESEAFDTAGFDRDGAAEPVPALDGLADDTSGAEREPASREAAALAAPGLAMTARDVPTDPTDLDRDLDRAGLDRADLDRADLDRADLDRADLDRADLDRADLDGPDATGLDPSRLDRFGLDMAGLDGVDLAELETGDGLGEVEALLGLTDLLCRADGYGPGPRKPQLAGAGAVA